MLPTCAGRRGCHRATSSTPRAGARSVGGWTGCRATEQDHAAFEPRPAVTARSPPPCTHAAHPPTLSLVPMDPAAGPALPWAAQPHRSSPPPTDWPAQLRWQCGATRVELRWAVEEEEEEEDGADADAAAPAERVLVRCGPFPPPLSLSPLSSSLKVTGCHDTTPPPAPLRSSGVRCLTSAWTGGATGRGAPPTSCCTTRATGTSPRRTPSRSWTSVSDGWGVGGWGAPRASALTSTLDQHPADTCYHLELEDEVACRVEGDAWEPPSSPEDEQQALSMSEVHEQITRAER